MVEDNLPCRGGVLLSVVASRLRVGQGLGMLVRVVVQIGLDEHRRNAAEGAQDQGVGADGREVSHGVARAHGPLRAAEEAAPSGAREERLEEPLYAGLDQGIGREGWRQDDRRGEHLGHDPQHALGLAEQEGRALLAAAALGQA